MLAVEITYDGANPAVYVIPEGVSVTVTDWSDSGRTETLVGPHNGPWPEDEDDESDGGGFK